ncbi:hypothetical protein EVAR_93573_1 [Eumeta japonica]|uniref:Uncharacterized protein n=1 Tax=Eumeta variegata TaxID=151549 RepID=A0A4C1UR55_EUMVA|nr:hypothetical protein EVAR_93573_1 [Eumeta japonica]
MSKTETETETKTKSGYNHIRSAVFTSELEHSIINPLPLDRIQLRAFGIVDHVVSSQFDLLSFAKRRSLFVHASSNPSILRGS